MGITRTDKAYQILDGKVIQTSVTGKERITGTTLGGIIGKSKFDTPFTAACKILGLITVDTNDSMRFGIYAEDKIFAELKRRGYSAFPASQIYTEGGSQVDYSTWRSHWDHPVFGGHLDGIDSNGDIWEIKTTSNFATWIGDAKEGKMTPPEHYHIQASLYAKLEGTDKIYFGVAPITPMIAANPTSFDPTQSDSIYVLECGLHPEIDAIMEQAETFYREYIAKGQTPAPDFTNSLDLEAVREIMTRTDPSTEAIHKFAKLHGELDRLTKSYIGSLEKELEELKKEIKKSVVFDDMEGVEYLIDEDILIRISKTYKTSLSQDKLKADGIDTAQYMETTESIKIEKKKPKKEK